MVCAMVMDSITTICCLNIHFDVVECACFLFFGWIGAGLCYLGNGNAREIGSNAR
jgi:hypothetical protein